MSENHLVRRDTDRLIAGICSGIAHYVHIDLVWVRLLFFVLTFASGIGVAIYFFLWLIMPLNEPQTGAATLQNNINDMVQTAQRVLQRILQADVLGVGLCVFGFFLLMQQLNLIGGLGRLFWPLLITAVGGYLLMRHNNKL